MKNSKKNIVLLSLSALISVFIIVINHKKIEDSLQVYSPFEAPINEFILMCSSYFMVSFFTFYLFLLRLFGLMLQTDTKKSFWNRLKEHKTLIIVLIISIPFKQILYIAQFTHIPFLFDLSMNFNLNVDWYFGSEPNMPYHFFAWEVIFWIFLLPIKLIRKNNFVLFPKI